MKILFAFENALPSTAADAEVFLTTAKHLSPLTTQSWLHLPANRAAGCAVVSAELGMPVVRALAPLRPAALRHFCCGLTLVFRREFRAADLVYTRNLWIAWISTLCGQRVVFDHYRPWPEQIPPLQWAIYRLICRPRFLVNICHSRYTENSYVKLGVPPAKLRCVRNGFEPQRLRPPADIETAKRQIGLDTKTQTVVYTGRVNHKKGLALAIEAARQLPGVLFLLVGSSGEGPIEKQAATLANVRIVGWQSPERLRTYIYAADVLLIPPSSQPLAIFGTTVLPLKVFLYMASGRPIIAGDTTDIREMLTHERNAYLCQPDQADALTAGIEALLADPGLRSRLAAAAWSDSNSFTWAARARKIARIVADRLHTPSAERGLWGRAHCQIWLQQSQRWLAHLIRQRSWVLPPRPG